MADKSSTSYERHSFDTESESNKALESVVADTRERLLPRDPEAVASSADVTVRECSKEQAAFNMFLYMFGATQIPYAIGQMGWYWGAL
jgi:hypothetical protein